jgi:hypothetical protein
MTAFSSAVSEKGYVEMKLSGTLSKDNFDELKKEVEEAEHLVKTVSAEKKKKLRVSFDLTEFTGVYNVGAMMLMKEFSDTNRPYVLKTAVFGGPDLARVAADITIQIIQDPTIKLFKDKESALAWLDR